MITDKNGKEVSVENILSYLTGTDMDDMAKSVIDFSLYKISEEKEVGDPEYYLIATDAIVTQISFIGPFTMLELDFRDIGVHLLEQVMGVINHFHSDINSDNVLMLSTITSLDKDATHIMSLANPLICVRGYSNEGGGTTILQLVYSTDNIGFTVNEVDYTTIDADVEREIQELEAMEVSKEAMEAAEEIMEDSTNDEMSQMFTPEFGLRDSSEKYTKESDSIRVSGKKTSQIKSKETSKIGSDDTTKITKDSED